MPALVVSESQLTNLYESWIMKLILEIVNFRRFGQTILSGRRHVLHNPGLHYDTTQRTGAISLYET